MLYGVLMRVTTLFTILRLEDRGAREGRRGASRRANRSERKEKEGCLVSDGVRGKEEKAFRSSQPRRVGRRSSTEEWNFFAHIEGGDVQHAPAEVSAGVRGWVRTRRLVGHERRANERREPVLVGQRRAHALHVRERVRRGQAKVARVHRLAEAGEQNWRDTARVSGGMTDASDSGTGSAHTYAGGDAPRFGSGILSRGRRSSGTPSHPDGEKQKSAALKTSVGRASRVRVHAPWGRGGEPHSPLPAVRVPIPANHPKTHLPERVRHRVRDAASGPTAAERGIASVYG